MEYVKLKDVANILNGYAFKSKLYVNSGIRVIRIANVQDGYISDENPCFYPDGAFDEISRYILKDGDLLISLTGNVGRVGILPTEYLPAALNQRVSCIRIKQDANLSLSFLYYYLLRKQFMRDCIKSSKGVAQLNLSTKWLENYLIPVFNLETQKKIVSDIDDRLSQLDSAIATLNKTKQQLEIYRQAVLKEAFGTFGQMATIKDVADTRLGKMLDKEKNIGRKRKYLRNINVRWFDFDLSDLIEMRIKDNEIEKYSITKGDLVMCEGGEPGRCAVWNKEQTIFYQKALHRIRFSEKSNPYFYMYYFWLINQSGFLSKYFTGTGIKHLTGQSLAKVPIPICSREQQNKIVSYIENKIKLTANIETTIDQSLQQAEALRQSILKQAFEEGQNVQR